VLYSFFKNPVYQLKQDNSFSQSLKELFVVLGYAMLALFINYVFVSLTDLLIKSTAGFSFLEAINHVQKLASGEKKVIFFLVFAPIVEELIFRLPLKISKQNIFIAMIAAYSLFYLSHKSLTTIITLRELFRFSVFVTVSFAVVFSLKEQFLSRLLNKYFGVYFYSLTVVFGLLHVANFLSLVPENLIFIAPLFALHQVIVGFFLGYLRIKNGLIWCILLHFMFNLLPTISYFLNR